MVGSPRGASCLPSTAEGFEGWREWWCGGGGCGGVPEVRTRTVALATACKIASSALLVTMGFFSFCCSLSRSAWRGTSGTAETSSHQNTEQWAVSTLLCPPLSLFFPQSFFFCLLLLVCPCAPIHH